MRGDDREGDEADGIGGLIGVVVAAAASAAAGDDDDDDVDVDDARANWKLYLWVAAIVGVLALIVQC